MKRTFLFLVAGLAIGAATPAGAETLWFGEGIVVARTTACGDSVSVGDFAKVTYRPAGATNGNGADSSLSWVASRSSHTLRVMNNSFRPAINYAGQSITSKAGYASKAGGILAFTETPGPGTDLGIEATFANFYTITGCTVTLRAALLPLP